MEASVLALLMFIMVCGVLLLGFPVAGTLAVVSLSFAILGSLLGVFDFNLLLGAVPSHFIGVMTNEVLFAVPLFVFMGLLSLPAMLKAGYDPKLATGTICASVTLGQVIPPSSVLVLLGDILQEANTQAQLARGNFAPDPVAVDDLFAGAFSPGLLLVGLYVAWILFKGLVDLKSCPALVDETGRPDDMTRRFF